MDLTTLLLVGAGIWFFTRTQEQRQQLISDIPESIIDYVSPPTSVTAPPPAPRSPIAEVDIVVPRDHIVTPSEPYYYTISNDPTLTAEELYTNFNMDELVSRYNAATRTVNAGIKTDAVRNNQPRFYSRGLIVQYDVQQAGYLGNGGRWYILFVAEENGSINGGTSEQRSVLGYDFAAEVRSREGEAQIYIDAGLA